MIKSEVERFFGEDSPLRHAGGSEGFKYEQRRQQVDMALAVADAMDAQENLCVEAPTGVGKTFAYLVPAVLYAKEKKQPVIISTHTISLQEQIMAHDVPLLSEMLGCEINAVVAKGQSNYLCLRRLDNVVDLNQEMLMLDGVAGDLSRLHKWANRTYTGDRSEIDFGLTPNLWQALCCERGNCAGPKCEFRKQCFLQRARRRVQAAEIIISNHAKLFSSLAAEQSKKAGKGEEDSDSVLPDYCAVILDEGHTIEDSASTHLGLKAGSFPIRYHLNRLYNSDHRTGIFSEEGYSFARGVVADTRRICDMFFSRIIEWMEPQNQNPLRYTVPGHIQNYLKTPLANVRNAIATTISSTDDASVKSELEGIDASLEEQSDTLDTFFNMSQAGYVYWLEREGKGETEVSMNAVPIDIAPALSQILFMKKPVIVTSATLAVNNDIGYFQRRVGCTDARALVLDTPFDYMNQVTLHIAQNMPDPRERGQFVSAAVEHIARFLKETDGRAFVLFTSYSLMNEIAGQMSGFFKREGMNLLVQGERLPPRKMLEEFRCTERSVIFGTASFWTGVDVPGDALSNVIITRLPFSVPDHPLIAARTEKIESEGGSAFFDYSVPEAVLKFRQGFGRLIRTKDDTGIVVVLDSRVVTKRYGKVFLDSIPACKREFF